MTYGTTVLNQSHSQRSIVRAISSATDPATMPRESYVQDSLREQANFVNQIWIWGIQMIGNFKGSKMPELESYPTIHEWQQQNLDLVNKSKNGELLSYQRACFRIKLQKEFADSHWLRLSTLGCIVLNDILDDWNEILKSRRSVGLPKGIVNTLSELIVTNTILDVYSETSDTFQDDILFETVVAVITNYQDVNPDLDSRIFVAPLAAIALIFEVTHAKQNKSHEWLDMCNEKRDEHCIGVDDFDVHRWGSVNLESGKVPSELNQSDLTDLLDKKKWYWRQWLTTHLRFIVESNPIQLQKTCKGILDKHANSLE